MKNKHNQVLSYIF